MLAHLIRRDHSKHGDHGIRFGSGGTNRSLTRTFDLPPITTFTLEGWVRWDGVNQGAMWGLGDSSAFYNSYISTSDSNNLKIYNGVGAPSTSPFPSDGRWHHVSTVISGTGSNQIAVWLDGVVHGLNDGNSSITAQTLSVGDEPVAGFGWQGAIKWFAAHAKALNAEEIAQRMLRPWDISIGGKLNTILALGDPHRPGLPFYGGAFTEVGSGFDLWPGPTIYAVPIDLRDQYRMLVSPADGGQTVAPGGVAGAEAFGTQRADQHVAHAGLAGGEVFGSQRVDQAVVGAGLAGAEGFGAHTVAIASDQGVTHTGLGTGEAFGGQRVDQSVVHAGLAGAEGFGASSVVLFVAHQGLASGEAEGSHTVAQDGPTTVEPPGLAGAEAFGGQQVDQLAAPGGVAGAEGFGAHAVALFVQHAALDGAEGFGGHTVALGDATVAPGSVPSGESMGTVVVTGGEDSGGGDELLYLIIWTRKGDL